MIEFYSAEIESTSLLGESESAHCCRVLRKKEGDLITVVDGKGNRFECKIIKSDSRKTEVEIIEKIRIEEPRNYKIVLCVSPTKNSDRMEWLVEKCVEIGIDRIIFFTSEHSERKNINIDRIRRVAVSAMKQSLKATLPKIEGDMTLTGIFDQFREDGSEKVMGYCSDEFERNLFSKTFKATKNYIILIGPEGDFSHKEIEKALQSGFIPVSFGEMRLRTETAALYGVTAIHVLNNLYSD